MTRPHRSPQRTSSATTRHEEGRTRAVVFPTLAVLLLLPGLALAYDPPHLQAPQFLPAATVYDPGASFAVKVQLTGAAPSGGAQISYGFSANCPPCPNSLITGTSGTSLPTNAGTYVYGETTIPAGQATTTLHFGVADDVPGTNQVAVRFHVWIAKDGNQYPYDPQVYKNRDFHVRPGSTSTGPDLAELLAQIRRLELVVTDDRGGIVAPPDPCLSCPRRVDATPVQRALQQARRTETVGVRVLSARSRSLVLDLGSHRPSRGVYSTLSRPVQVNLPRGVEDPTNGPGYLLEITSGGRTLASAAIELDRASR